MTDEDLEFLDRIQTKVVDKTRAAIHRELDKQLDRVLDEKYIVHLLGVYLQQCMIHTGRPFKS